MTVDECIDKLLEPMARALLATPALDYDHAIVVRQQWRIELQAFLREETARCVRECKAVIAESKDTEDVCFTDGAEACCCRIRATAPSKEGKR